MTTRETVLKPGLAERAVAAILSGRVAPAPDWESFDLLAVARKRAELIGRRAELARTPAVVVRRTDGERRDDE